MLSSAGVPIYLHYCGGELEEVSYLVKSNSCCGDEDTQEDNGCCKDENLLLLNTADVILKQADGELHQLLSEEHVIALPWSASTATPSVVSCAPPLPLHAPEALLQTEVVRTSVLRI